MGVIKDIGSRVTSNVRLQPTARADQFGGAEANAVASLGGAISRTAGAFQEDRISNERRQQAREEQAEVSQLRADVSKVRSDLTVELQETLAKADPGDNTIVESFQNKVQERLGSLRENVLHDPGRNFLVQAGASMEGDFQRTAFSGQAKLAGEKAVLDNRNAINNYSVSAFNDPAAVNSILAEFNGGLSAAFKTNPSLSQNDIQQLSQQGRQDIIKSAIQGWIKTNPAMAREKLSPKNKKGETLPGEFDDDLTGVLKKQLLDELKVAENAIRIEDQRVDAENRRIKKQKDDNTKSAMLEKLDTQSLSTREVLDSDLGFDDKKLMLSMIRDKVSRPDIVRTDQSTLLDLQERAALPSTDERSLKNDALVWEAYINRMITKEDRDDVLQTLEGKNTQAGRVRIKRKSTLLKFADDELVGRNKVTGIAKDKGMQRYAEFEEFMREAVQQAEQKNEDVDALFDPDSNKWLGHQVIRFKSTTREDMRGQLKELRARKGQGKLFKGNQKRPIRKIRPGEDLDAFLKDTEGQ